jgi:hypothetical protein
MCVILVSPNGQRFDVDELEAAQLINSDGVGVAWRTDDGLISYRKFAEFNKDLWRQPKGTCIIHFRLATAGGPSVDMAHPFPITRSAGVRRWGKAKRVLFHNGHIFGWERDRNEFIPRRLRQGAPWSDSRLLAYCIHRFGIDYVNDMSMILGQRVAIFDSDNLDIFGQWGQDSRTSLDGIWRSNTSHLSFLPYKNWEYFDLDDRPIMPAPYRSKLIGSGRNNNPGLSRECCSFNESHVEHLCLECNEVICPECYDWGLCLVHSSCQLTEEPKRYSG